MTSDWLFNIYVNIKNKYVFLLDELCIYLYVNFIKKLYAWHLSDAYKQEKLLTLQLIIRFKLLTLYLALLKRFLFTTFLFNMLADLCLKYIFY